MGRQAETGRFQGQEVGTMLLGTQQEEGPSVRIPSAGTSVTVDKGLLIQGMPIKAIYPFQLSLDRFSLLRAGVEK